MYHPTYECTSTTHTTSEALSRYLMPQSITDNHYHIAKILSIDKTTTSALLIHVRYPPVKCNVETFIPAVQHKPSRHEATRHHREGPNQFDRCHRHQVHGRGTHNTSRHRYDGRHENQYVCKILCAMNDYSHHVITRTWMQNNTVENRHDLNNF